MQTSYNMVWRKRYLHLVIHGTEDAKTIHLAFSQRLSEGESMELGPASVTDLCFNRDHSKTLFNLNVREER